LSSFSLVRNSFALLAVSLFCFSGYVEVSSSEQVQVIDRIYPSETVSLNTTVGLNTSEMSFVLFWENATSSLDAVLYSPSGTEINSSAPPSVIYGVNNTLIYYIVHRPEPGEWVAKIQAAAVPDVGESYWVIFNTTASEAEVLTEEIPVEELAEDVEGCANCTE